MIFVDEGEIVTVTRDGVTITDFEGKPHVREPKIITWSAVQAEKGGFKHFMLKEIHEQPRAVADTLVGRVDLEHDDVAARRHRARRREDQAHHLRRVRHVVSRVDGRRVPRSRRSRGSRSRSISRAEFRYRDPIVGPGDLVVAVSQSGETLDTMEAIREAKKKGATGARDLERRRVVDPAARRLRVLHARGSGDRRRVDEGVHHAARRDDAARDLSRPPHRRRCRKERARALLAELVQLPQKMRDVVESGAQLQVLARRYGHANGFLFLGRGSQYPIALEGALKLKEISYIHAEGYAAGEMKHGPIALIDEHLPVVVLVPRGPHYEKIDLEPRRGARAPGQGARDRDRATTRSAATPTTSCSCPTPRSSCSRSSRCCRCRCSRYYVADFKGTDIDQPRNLAKSVTVE